MRKDLISAMKVMEFVVEGYSIGLAAKMAGWTRIKNPSPQAAELYQKARDMYFDKRPINLRGGWA